MCTAGFLTQPSHAWANRTGSMRLTNLSPRHGFGTKREKGDVGCRSTYLILASSYNKARLRFNQPARSAPPAVSRSPVEAFKTCPVSELLPAGGRAWDAAGRSGCMELYYRRIDWLTDGQDCRRLPTLTRYSGTDPDLTSDVTRPSPNVVSDGLGNLPPVRFLK